MITDITVENKFVLIYDGATYKSGSLTTGNVTSPYTVEVFDTAQELFDRAYSLGLQCSTEDLLRAMEHGAILPDPVMELLNSYIWGYEYMTYWKRMEALGHFRPNINEGV